MSEFYDATVSKASYELKSCLSEALELEVGTASSREYRGLSCSAVLGAKHIMTKSTSPAFRAIGIQ